MTVPHKPDPLCQFSDRLFFTTFPHPSPPPALLNKTPSDPTYVPRVRGRPKFPSSAMQGPTPPKHYWFTIDDQLLYLSFFQDWGPLNLAMVYKACILIHELLEDKELESYRLVLYSSNDPRRKANAALLMALYVMIVQRRAPWEAFHPIAEVEFMPFRDAGRGPSDFNLNIQDCLWGIWKAMQNGLCDMNEFNVEDYEFYEKVENGDWNWLTPHFIAFASPVDPTWIQHQKEQLYDEHSSRPPNSRGSLGSSTNSNLALQRKLPTPFLNCLDYFEKKNVRLVVRLNTQLYDRETFLDRGIDHMELYFDDGTNPTDEIVRTFIDISDKVIEDGGVVAVHCKAGLGRTGTLIGAYLIWKYGFTANEAIAFMRIVRPGSVVGPQQQYLYLKQLEWTKWAAADELKRLQAEKLLSAPLLVQVDPNIRPVTPTSEHSDEEAMTVDPVTPTAARFHRSAVPPITPSRHVATAQAKVKANEPPGQPRKTPTAKRSLSARDDSSDEENEIADVLPPLNQHVPRNAGKLKARVRDGSASDPPRTRAAAAASRKDNPGPASPVKGKGPNKIPRLAATRTARAAAAIVPKTSVKRKIPATASTTNAKVKANPPPSPTHPSRLPTLVKKHTPTLSEVANAAVPASKSKRPLTSNEEKNKWMTANAKAVVSVPASKVASSDRPGLRPVRRRRSSFSNADVVA